ncbi:MAG: hypothetical protein ACTHMY_01830 [Solirubrobacteraceae bacterium]
MTTQSDEPTVRDRVEQRPKFSLGKVRETTARELIIRFVAGAATSIASGAVTLIFGHLPGGVVMVISTVVWGAAAVLGYVVLWWR